jgi:hypothetical protein
VTTTVIAVAAPRARVRVWGAVRSVRSVQRPGVRADVEMTDGTGDGEHLVVLNPLYSFDGAG